MGGVGVICKKSRGGLRGDGAYTWNLGKDEARVAAVCMEKRIKKGCGFVQVARAASWGGFCTGWATL